MNKWPIKRLGKVADIYGGGTPPTSHPEYFQGDTNWFTPSELPVDNIGTVSESNRKITDQAEHFTTISGPGTILLGSRASIGSVAILSTTSGYNQGIKGIEPKKEEVNNWFLGYWLKANTDELLRKSFGTTFKEINTTAVKQLTIPVPPLKIQEKIVERLDTIRKAQELCDKQIQKTEELFSSLLDKELSAKFNKQKLGEVVELIMGQSPPSSSYNEEGKGLPFFQGKAEFGEIYPIPVKYCSSPNRIAEAGDILMSVRAPVGNINLTKERACVGRGLAVLSAKKNILNQMFLYYFMKRNENNWSRLSVGSTFSAIRRNNLENFDMPLPPMELQKQIVEKLSSVQEYKKLLIKQKELLKELFDSVLHKSMRE